MGDFQDRIMSWNKLMFILMLLLTCILEGTRHVNGQICRNAPWRNYGDSQYLIVNNPKSSWENAHAYCQNRDANLATITSREQTMFLITYTNKGGEGWNYWIGLNDEDNNGYYTWIDGTRSSYTHWRFSTGPSSSGDCVRMRSTRNIVDQGKWQTSGCAQPRVFICQRTIDPRCSWNRFGQSLFRFYGESKSYTNARTDCKGGDLAVIKSIELRSFLVDIISTPPRESACYRIGLIDENRDNKHYMWIDGTPLHSNDEFWNEGEPNYNNEDCVCMLSFISTSASNQGRWNDLSCEYSDIPYICERTQVMDNEWTHFSNVQYYMPGFSTNYFDATEYCQQLGGTLAQIKTSEIYANITNGFGNSFWFGLDSLNKEGVFQWADDTLLRNSRFTKWQSGYPAKLQGYQFCVVQTSGYWYNVPCNEEHRFLCEKSKGCPAGRWNVPVCDLLCDNCYNGGVCNHHTGSCICAPGFTGKNCLTACGDHKFGFECGLVCGSSGGEDSSCSDNRVCLLESNQCSCLAGYTGDFCNETCTGRKFGSDCLQDCHCIGGRQCDISTGGCEGRCESGWSGDGCQVPSVCPKGYFGINCTDHCNCPGGTDCDKESGFCRRSEGQCEIGFTTDSVELPQSCSSFTGCFDLCSKTCHCRDGESDCNSVDGSCTSDQCHPRWTGDNCQTDRFQFTREKTNPGVAIFSCALHFDSPTNVESDFMKAAIGDFSTDNWVVTNSPQQNVSSTLFNFTFSVEDFVDSSPIYCFIGHPLNESSEFGYVKLPPGETFVLPSLTTPPNVVSSSYYWVVISWKTWVASSDGGEGPITGYKVYVNTEDGKETHTATVLPDGSVDSGSTRNKRELGSVEYNISALEDGTTYEVRVAAIRKGPNGEGERGPPLIVKTQELPTDKGNPGSLAATAGGAIGGILVVLCLVIIIILLLRRKRGRHDNNGERSNLPKSSNNDYLFPGQAGADEEAGGSVPTQSAPSPSSKKPTVSPKRFTLAASQYSLDTEEGGAPSAAAKGSSPNDRQPIPLSEFPAFVQKNRHSKFFQEEFRELPEANIYPQTIANRKINFEKNRYKNILPYDSTRVRLAILNGDPNTDYFNASYIPSFQEPERYIASQGPNAASMDDFWRMIWQENVTTIAMVTNLQEGNKIKCRQYWPENCTTPVHYGDITLEMESVQQCSGGSKRSLVLRKEKEVRFVNQFHYTKWPDRDVPRDTTSLLKFVTEVQKDHGQNQSPLLIHCSAGVGRTGVVITIDSVLAEAKRIRQIDIFGFVSKIRQNRPCMVQTQEQYKFVYEAILESLLSEDTDIPVNYFTARLAKLHDVDRSSNGGRRTGMSIQFENIKILCPDPPASSIRTGTMPMNRPKSRYANSLPTEMNRISLQSVDVESSDFLNASFVKGQYGRYITAQMPMPNTVNDFWIMVLDYKPPAIIMLNDDNQQDKTCARYWSDDGSSTFGAVTVSTLSTTVKSGFIQRRLEVARGKSKVRHVVEQYQFLDWPGNVGAHKKGARSILALMGEVREAYATKLDSPLLVHCLSGVGRSAVFCSVLECIAQIKNENVVNVFQTVTRLRNERMHFVQNEEEYSFIHILIKEYLYANDYEQLASCDDQEHTYGNVESGSTSRDVENVYEVTDIQGGGALAYQKPKPNKKESVNGKSKQVQPDTKEGEVLYANYGQEN